jgi:hypothetical protein
MTPAAIKYKDKLEELQMCINELAENPQLFGYDTFIEIMKLQLEVSKEIYRIEVIDI